jgi:serum/glucocorticoid-regulated kinase 2
VLFILLAISLTYTHIHTHIQTHINSIIHFFQNMGQDASKEKGREDKDSKSIFRGDKDVDGSSDGGPSPGKNQTSPNKSASSGGSGQLAGYSKADEKMTIESFDLIRVLGRGSFGKVMLATKKDDENPQKKLYAMKVLKKAVLIKRNQVTHTECERKILEHIKSPFLISLHFAFQTAEKLYMVMDFMAGGELFHWLRKDKKFEEPRAKLYAAEIICALEALHNADIIYRDLKTENIMVHANGHLRLVDFGLAKAGVTGPGAEGGTKTFCGTPEYLAPEILENRGHGKAVDWWALGTLLFEMLTGLPPFYDNNVQKMYHKILHDPLTFPKSADRQVSPSAKEVLVGLLTRPIAERLGSQGPDQLKRRAFFAVFDFKQVVALGYEPVFKPTVDEKKDPSINFDQEFTDEKPTDSVVAPVSQSMEKKFEDFTFDENKMKDSDAK